MIYRHLGTLSKTWNPRLAPVSSRLKSPPFTGFLKPSGLLLQSKPQRFELSRNWAPQPHNQHSHSLRMASFSFYFTPLKAMAITEAASSPSLLVPSVMLKTVTAVLFIGFLAWLFQAIRPPPPRICGSPGGPPVTGPRIKLRDGRYLAYLEYGVPKDSAKYKVVLVHGFSGSKYDASIATAEAVQELGVYFVSFDRPGYGESDPDPKRSVRSLALDIEDLADQLELGSKFYVVGTSMGGQAVWGCLKYISHRLAGVALIVPVVNYRWPGFPPKLSAEAYYQQYPEDQWSLRVAYYAPWLTYWWNTQKLFPSSSVASGRPTLSRQDLELVSKLRDRPTPMGYPTQQGLYESFHKDMNVGFGKWEFSPMDLEDPFPNGEGSIHLWQGDEDGLVPVTLQRYIAEKLPWIHYHEIPGAGHLLGLADDNKEAILRALLDGGK
ncbi:OLC1v1026351C1 [Oldenlandia corymbosa var. corymbosa]|uniref:OLC1v1026351C1 n=1 Tax=Oldenlandia corymbosa var. corymbosa TaxID=529605 RepID=A0AAV1C8L8_OLDCO|nr:OLC1v1026351C1 [Oldenlandia corymbosa var. corymbosa]